MSIYIDTLPFELFKKMKNEYEVKTMLIRPEDLSMAGVLHAYKTPEEYVKAQFLHQWGIEVYRYRHEYKTLESDNPKLGVVFMANDSVIIPGLEAHVLIHHNARYVLSKVPDEPS